jgi:hypothetical protein
MPLDYGRNRRRNTRTTFGNVNSFALVRKSPRPSPEERAAVTDVALTVDAPRHTIS